MSSPKDTLNRNSPKTAVPTQPEIENGLGSPAEKVTAVGPPRKVLFGYVSMGMLQLLVLFWFVTSFLLGKMYQQSDYTHRLHVFAVDFDGGQIGESLLQTVEGLNGQHGQPTWQPIRYDSGETYNSIYNKVWEGNSIWGAIIANPGVSNRLTSAITTESNDTYNANDALKIIFNESRYRTVGLSVIESNLIAAVSQTAITYQMSFGLENISLLPNNATAQNKVALMEPIGYSSINMQPFGFSATPLINTVMFVFPVLAQFFLVLVLNGVFGKSGAYGQWSLRSNLATRFFFGTVWSCIVGLSWASWIYIWKNGVAMGSKYFFMVWMTMWLYSALNFWVIDGVCSLVEMQWMPFFVLSWIICQVAGVISPPDLASRFYRVDYILPSHHTWGVLMTIFGHGANNHLGTNLTVCFVWLVVSVVWGVFGNWTRWKRAQILTAGNA